MSTVLAIDQGTSGTKALVVDSNGEVLAHHEVSLRPRYLADGGVEQDPLELLDSVLQAGRTALQLAAVPVDIVTLANQGESVLAWDPGTGAPFSPVVVWQDRRSAAICQELSAQADLIRERTGLTLDPYFSAPKQTWIRRNLTTQGVVTTTDTWLIFQLTRAFVTDASTASRSLIFDVNRGEWDEELAALFGLSSERQPQIVDNNAIVGTTTCFGREIPVGGLIVDQQAALIGHGCFDLGEAKCTFGTGAFLVTNTGSELLHSASGLVSSVAWRTRESTRFSVDGQVYTVASAVRWMTQLGLVASASELDHVAAHDPQGVLFVPALAGLGAPRWRPDATAILTGMTLSTRPEHIVRAVLEGIAAQVTELVHCTAADLGSPIRSLNVDGGLTRSSTLMQTVADIAQIPIKVTASPHATALGAASLARNALDPLYPSTIQ